MTHTVNDLQKIFDRAANSALVSWRIDSGHDDLVNELWVWYLERPSVQKKMGESDRRSARNLAYRSAQQMLSKRILKDNEFGAVNPYSSEAIKDALKGESSNRYLQELLPMAMSNLDRQNSAQAEAIRSRYTDQVVPKSGSAGQALLTRAVKSLTEHVNVLAITAGIRRNEDGSFTADEGPGSRGTVFPETRKQRGRHSDPTANLAVALLDDEDVRYEAYRVGPLNEFLAGAGGSVVLDLGGARYRATGVEAAALKADPNLRRRTIRRKKKLLNE